MWAQVIMQLLHHVSSLLASFCPIWYCTSQHVSPENAVHTCYVNKNPCSCFYLMLNVHFKTVSRYKGKGKFFILYSAVANLEDCSKCFTSYRPVQSNIILASLGSIQPYATINAWRQFVHKYPPLSIARCSCIQLSELDICGVNQFRFEPGFS